MHLKMVDAFMLGYIWGVSLQTSIRGLKCQVNTMMEWLTYAIVVQKLFKIYLVTFFVLSKFYKVHGKHEPYLLLQKNKFPNNGAIYNMNWSLM